MDKREQTTRRGLKLCQEMFGLDNRKNLFPEKGDSILEWAAQGQGGSPTVGDGLERKTRAGYPVPRSSCHGGVGSQVGYQQGSCKVMDAILL